MLRPRVWNAWEVAPLATARSPCAMPRGEPFSEASPAISALSNQRRVRSCFSAFYPLVIPFVVRFSPLSVPARVRGSPASILNRASGLCATACTVGALCVMRVPTSPVPLWRQRVSEGRQGAAKGALAPAPPSYSPPSMPPSRQNPADALFEAAPFTGCQPLSINSLRVVFSSAGAR